MHGISSLERLPFRHKFFLVVIVILSIFILCSSRVSAATLNVSTGVDETTTNSSCSLSEAIQNIKDQAVTNTDCLAGDGSDDTISIPAGTVTLTADLPLIDELSSIKIEGAGANQTSIDGDNGQYRTLNILNVSNVSISQIGIIGFRTVALRIVEQDVPNSSVNLNNIDINGENATSNDSLQGIFIQNNGSGAMTLNSSNIYVHSFNHSNGYTHVFIVDQTNGGSLNANISNTTVANIHSTGPEGVNGFMTSMGPYGGNGSGILNATITNTTIEDITSEDLTAPFNSFVMATDTGESGTVTTNVHNLTITGVRGNTSTYGEFAGLQSAAFFSATVANTGSTATSTVNVDNSLIANNFNDGIPHNCSAVDLTNLFGMNGTGVATINSNGHNISDDNSCSSFTQDGDQQNVNNIISTLGPLQNNGGSVPTRALLTGSPAIGAGAQVLGISTDARGVARTAGSWDVGAFQTVLADNTTTPVSTNSGAGGTLADTGQGMHVLLVAFLFVSSGILLARILLSRNSYSIKR